MDGTDGVDGMDGMSGSGPSALIQLVDEPAGTNCAAGGQLVNVGFDDDMSGSLEASEVDDSSYLCNGTAGAAGGCSVSASEGGSQLPLGLFALGTVILGLRRRQRA